MSLGENLLVLWAQRLRRAEAVVHYLVGQCGIDPQRLLAKGFGMIKTSNDTEEGRQNNRRVEIRNLGAGRAEP